MNLSRPHSLRAGEQSLARVVATPTPVLRWLPADSSMRSDLTATIEAIIDGATPVTANITSAGPSTSWPWAALPSRASVRWRVRETDTAWSAWADFTTPLWTAHDWSASWISPPEAEQSRAAADRGAWILRRDFDLDLDGALVDGHDHARLYATALGVYSVRINGIPADDTLLAPGSSSYDRTLYGQAYDVGRLLTEGRNSIEFTVSDGWLRGRNGGSQHRDVWGDTLGVLARLEVQHSRGSIAIVTDHEWMALPSSTVRADLMTGQTTDLRIDTDGPGRPVLVGAVEPPLPAWSPAPPVRRIQEFPPATITALRPGISIVDTGQNLSGWLRPRALGQPGQVTTLEYGEHLDPTGDLTTAHLDLQGFDGIRIPFEQKDVVIAGADDATFEPEHTVHGFQFVRISHPGRTLSIDDLTVVVVHSDLSRTGWFSCDDDELTRLHEAAVWSFRSNIVDVPTDCPTRERSAWTGDFGVFAPVAARLYDIDGFAQKWLHAVRDDQAPDGVPAMFSPDSERLRQRLDSPTRITGGSAGWGDALVDVPWTLYREYADQRVLHEHWDSMKAWVDYALGCAATQRHPARTAARPEPAEHERWIWDAPFHFGEWMEPKTRGADGTLIDPMVVDPMGYMGADRGETGTAYLYRSASRLAEIARVTGRQADATNYQAIAEHVAEAWRTEFLRPDSTTADDSQAGYVRALAFGLIPVELRSQAANRLAELIRANNTRIATGFLSSGMILPVLADHGHLGLAYELLQRKGTPSWLGMLERGATTMWEEWEGIDEQGTATASLNHYSKGAVIGFLHSHVAGLSQEADSVGWERIRIAPRPGGGLTSAQTRFVSPRGPIEVSWLLRVGQLEFTISLPPTTRATIDLPGQRVQEIGPGDHHLLIPLEPEQAEPRSDSRYRS